MHLYLRRKRRRRGDEGVGIVVALMVALLAMSLSLLVAQVAVNVGRESGVDRQRTVAVSAAEAGVDAAVAAIASGGTNPPCSWPASGMADTGSYPDITTVSATIAYSDASGGALSCGGGAVTGTAVRATVTATAATQALAGGSTRGQRSMLAVVDLVPPASALPGDAIFADAGVNITNSLALTSDPGGPPADVYTNHDLACSNHSQISGNLYSQGAATLACDQVTGDVWSRGTLTGRNNFVFGGSAKTAGAYYLDGQTTVTGTLIASGGKLGGAYVCTPPKCLQNQGPAVPGPPPPQSFQTLTWDASTEAVWRANGWTIVTKSTCDESKPWLSAPLNLTNKTVLVTNCAVSLSQDLTLTNDLAVVSFGGFTVSGSSISSSTPGALRRLYGIIPANATPTTLCSGLTMSTSQQVTLTDADLLLYTPCDVTLNNRGTLQGQVHAGGTVTVANNMGLVYHQLPVYGVMGFSTAYTAAITQKYEVRTPTSSP